MMISYLDAAPAPHESIILCSLPKRKPLQPMDMHAWFEAFVGGRWYTFDATQDQPLGNRIVVVEGIQGHERLVINPGDSLAHGAEIQIGLEEWLGQIPEFRIRPGSALQCHASFQQALVALPIEIVITDSTAPA